ncbi:diacylglycerol/lipid kinase family protein [Halorussus sp. AFM4]|uniref:diacylglycerol/lipid kinase family protein n=1 Tax=Halorussus sp. AFM4 TaxID=3421651 RepID=UPI003EC03C35
MTDETDGVVVLNPVSGTGEHADRVRSLAAEHGYAVRETREEGDAVSYARDAVGSGASLVAAAGGDGTLNEVLRGVDAEDAFDDVTVGVVPVGTGNDFADNVGVTDVESAFEVLADGERRRLDLGMAGDRPFVNSCIAGLTAEASAETTPELKNRYGVLAYVLTTLRTLSSFEGLDLDVRVGARDGGRPVWEGDAVLVLIGNGRRFPTRGRPQANVEDGRFDVAIVEDRPAIDLMGDRVVERLFGQESPSVARLKAPSLTVSVAGDEPATFSLDGEILTADSLSLTVRPRTLRMPVGETYDPSPE